MFENLTMFSTKIEKKKINRNLLYRIGTLMDELTIKIEENSNVKLYDYFEHIDIDLTKSNKQATFQNKLKSIFNLNKFNYSENLYEQDTVVYTLSCFNEFSQLISLDFCHFHGIHGQFDRLEMYITIQFEHNEGRSDYITDIDLNLDLNENFNLFFKNSLAIINHVLNNLLFFYNKQIGLL